MNNTTFYIDYLLSECLDDIFFGLVNKMNYLHDKIVSKSNKYAGPDKQRMWESSQQLSSAPGNLVTRNSGY